MYCAPSSPPPPHTHTRASGCACKLVLPSSCRTSVFVEKAKKMGRTVDYVKKMSRCYSDLLIGAHLFIPYHSSLVHFHYLHISQLSLLTSCSLLSYYPDSCLITALWFPSFLILPPLPPPLLPFLSPLHIQVPRFERD